jgi:Ca2+-binding RTX toxin-like protein
MAVSLYENLPFANFEWATKSVTIDLWHVDRFSQAVIGADGAGPNPDTIGEELEDSARNPHALVGYAQGVELGTIILINIHNAVTGSGNDTLIGHNENNNLDGGPGNDYFIPWFGTDNLEGGPGIDTVDYRYFSGRTIVDLHNSYATWPDDPGYPNIFDNVIRFENALTGPSNDQLLGNKEANDLWAGAGKDILRGAGANDWLHGEKVTTSFGGTQATTSSKAVQMTTSSTAAKMTTSSMAIPAMMS